MYGVSVSGYQLGKRGILTSGPKTTSCLRSAFAKYPRRLDGLPLSFPPPGLLGDADVVRSCVASSLSGSLGGNCGAGASGVLRCERKYGIVATRGESAQGLLRDARSCSKVGSTKLVAERSACVLTAIDGDEGC